MKIGPITFQVAPGDITKEEADVIVNSTSQTFNLKAGTLLVNFYQFNSHSRSHEGGFLQPKYCTVAIAKLVSTILAY